MPSFQAEITKHTHTLRTSGINFWNEFVWTGSLIILDTLRAKHIKHKQCTSYEENSLENLSHD